MQIAKRPVMKSREEFSLQMERKSLILSMDCSNGGKCAGFYIGSLGIILAVASNIKGMFNPYTLSDLSRHELKETGLREYDPEAEKDRSGKVSLPVADVSGTGTDCKSRAFPVGR